MDKELLRHLWYRHYIEKVPVEHVARDAGLLPQKVRYWLILRPKSHELFEEFRRDYLEERRSLMAEVHENNPDRHQKLC